MALDANYANHDKGALERLNAVLALNFFGLR